MGNRSVGEVERMTLKTVIGLLVLAMGLGVLLPTALAAPLARDLTYKQNKDSVDVLKDGVPVARYDFSQSFPTLDLLGRRLGDEKTEIAIASIRVGYDKIEDANFWNVSKTRGGTIKQTALNFDSIEPGYWNIHASNEWIGRGNKLICREDRRHSFLSSPDGLVVSTMITLFPANGDLHLEYTDKAFYRLQLPAGTDYKLANSLGSPDRKCIGQRAQWLLAQAKVMGNPYSFALFDLPANYGYPVQWNLGPADILSADPFAKWQGSTGKYALTIPDLGAEAFVYVCLVAPGELPVDRVKAFARERLRVPEEKSNAGNP